VTEQHRHNKEKLAEKLEVEFTNRTLKRTIGKHLDFSRAFYINEKGDFGMIDACLERDGLVISSVTEEDLPRIWSWYKDVKRYKYATGLDHPITFDEMKRKYMEACCSRWEFFFKISDKSDNIMLGVVKGRIHYLLKDEAWISSILIDEAYQNTGIGHIVVSMLEEYFRSTWCIKWLYTGVASSNKAGLDFWMSNKYQKVRKTRYQIVLDEKPEDIIIMVKNLDTDGARTVSFCQTN
jgi:ribosomal protein S18 acetylase RimI-like enzyme